MGVTDHEADEAECDSIASILGHLGLGGYGYCEEMYRVGVLHLADFTCVSSVDELKVFAPSLTYNVVHLLKLWHAVTHMSGHPAGAATKALCG